MKLIVNGETYDVSQEQSAELLAGFHTMGLSMYQEQSMDLRFLLKPLTRWILERWEKRLKPIVGKERAAEICRPPNRKDPVVHTADLMMQQLGVLVNHATLSITTEGSRATGFNFEIAPPEDQSGGPLDLNGHVREREDYRS